MNKLESLQNLKAWGFNIAPFVVWSPDLTIEAITEKVGKLVNIRTCTDASTHAGQPPFHYSITPTQAWLIGKSLNFDGYHVIIHAPVPKKISYINGHVVVRIDGSGFYEISYQRDHSRGGMKNPMNLHRRQFDWKFRASIGRIEPVMMDVIKECKDILLFSKEESLVIEFTVADEPVGYRKEELIFWEYRSEG